MTTDRFLFVTGSPRSGTTYVSDWLTQLPDVYCVHEVLSELRDWPPAQVLQALLGYARAGSDRLAKPLQREFLSWPDSGLQTEAPMLLGWKEPVTWRPGGLAACPEPLRTALRQQCDRAVVTLRHPFDVVASGRRRERSTTNWRPLSIEEHCEYWFSALELAGDLDRVGAQVLVLRWESMVVDPAGTADRLGELIGLRLPEFAGYERTGDELSGLRAAIDQERGLVDHPHRDALTGPDRDRIWQLVGNAATGMGYRR